MLIMLLAAVLIGYGRKLQKRRLYETDQIRNDRNRIYSK